MNNNVDYDKMFGTNSPPKTERERQYEERCRQYADERNGLNETVEQFRSRPKNHEGFFERADTFTELQEARDPFARYRRKETSLLDFIAEYIDGCLVGTLFGVITWLLTHSKVPVTIAVLIGFTIGLVLQFRVHDRLSAKETIKNVLPGFIVVFIVSVYVLADF